MKPRIHDASACQEQAHVGAQMIRCGFHKTPGLGERLADRRFQALVVRGPRPAIDLLVYVDGATSRFDPAEARSGGFYGAGSDAFTAAVARSDRFASP
jgi:hypothetical protein